MGVRCVQSRAPGGKLEKHRDHAAGTPSNHLAVVLGSLNDLKQRGRSDEAKREPCSHSREQRAQKGIFVESAGGPTRSHQLHCAILMARVCYSHDHHSQLCNQIDTYPARPQRFASMSLSAGVVGYIKIVQPNLKGSRQESLVAGIRGGSRETRSYTPGSTSPITVPGALAVEPHSGTSSGS